MLTSLLALALSGVALAERKAVSFAPQSVPGFIHAGINPAAPHIDREALGAAVVQDLVGAGADYSIVSQRDYHHLGMYYTRFNQLVEGLPLYPEGVMSVGVNHEGDAVASHGAFFDGITSLSKAGHLTEELALELAIARHGGRKDRVVRNVEVRQVAYLDDETDGAHPGFLVSFFSDSSDPTDPSPVRPTVLLSTHGDVIDEFDQLNTISGDQETYAYGPGGNEKIGQYWYGTDYDTLDVTRANNISSMVDEHVMTVNMNEQTQARNVAFTFNGDTNTYKQINGGFSPINDAHSWGRVIWGMYNELLDVDPLEFDLVMRVHYGQAYENAFWDGTQMNFGDGASTFYPLVSCDVATHEVSHGFTQQHSNLIYKGESGGINEAYSDIAGETGELYFFGEVDWMIGAQITKPPLEALRYFADPPKDGRSIDCLDDYHYGIDVHYSSGIFLKAFYLLANSDGFDINSAFQAFAHANMNYWVPSATFTSAAQGVLDAATDLGLPTDPVVKAMQGVCIKISSDEELIVARKAQRAQIILH